MTLNALNAISPIDGRYSNKTSPLKDFFSEYALFKYRLRIEVEYFIALCELPLEGLANVNKNDFTALRSFYEDFSEADAQRIKDIEKITNHDVKAVEYFLKEKFDTIGLTEYAEFIHFGLTSQDINNTATPLLIKEALIEVYAPGFHNCIVRLKELAEDWKDVPMLARTHGQPASPTKLGKEFLVFVERLENQEKLLQQIPFSAKFGGATGNLNAHHVAYPDIDWVAFANKFVDEQIGLSRSQVTTQIEHYDNMAALFDNLRRVNVILLDLCRDVWTYIMLDYFKQKIKAGEVGSSAMPHKVNPIDFENAEGNFGLANAVFNHLSQKLPVSRLQRDLTDSTVTRNVGVPMAYTLIAFKSLLKGLDKLMLNENKLKADLDNNWAVVTEAIQNVLRREGYPKPYEKLKEFARTNDTINEAAVSGFINKLDVSEVVKDELRRITPHNYTGVSFH